MAFEKAYVTEKGRELIAYAMANDKAVEFTKTQIGTGIYRKEEKEKKELKQRTGLKEVLSTLPILNKKDIGNGNWKLTMVISNREYTEDKAVTELAVFAKAEGHEEILYSISVADLAETVPKYNGEYQYTITEEYIAAVSSDIEVTITEPVGAYALAVDLMETREELEQHLTEAMEELAYHLDGTDNPHHVTKEQIGLGNADNTSDTDKPVSTAQQRAIDLAYASANGYTDEKIADLINGAPETLDTLSEIAEAMENNQGVVQALDAAIGKKASQMELDTHTGNDNIHISQAERSKWNDAAKTVGGVHNIAVPAGFSSSHFVEICKVKPGANYQNQPILFHVIQRGRNGIIKLLFANGNGTQNFNEFEACGNINAYIKLKDNFEWHIYLKISEPYDNISITQVEMGTYMSSTIITWMSECLTELPAGYAQASVFKVPFLFANQSGSAGTLGRGGDTNCPMTFHWQGKNEQPTWLWGGHDGTDMYVYSPSVITCGKATADADGNNIKDTYIKRDFFNFVEDYVLGFMFPKISVKQISNGQYSDILTVNNSGEMFFGIGKSSIIFHSTTIDFVTPKTDNSIYLGSSNKRWKNIYAASSVISTSDKNEKKCIEDLDGSRAMDLIMGIRTKIFKFIDGSSDRTHWGMISQDIEELLEELGMDSKDFAGFIKAPKTQTVEYEEEYEVEEEVEREMEIDGEIVIEKTMETVTKTRTLTKEEVIDGEFVYGLRYEEFISPVIKVEQILVITVQEQQKEINELKKEVSKQWEEINKLKKEVEELKEMMGAVRQSAAL